MANAIASSDRALALNPDNVEALVGRAYALSILGLRIAEGEALYLRALQLRPNDVTANNLAGDMYRLLGDRELAFKYERRAVELDPLDAVHQWDLSNLMIEDGNWEEALTYARRASALAPRGPAINFEIWSLIMLGQFDTAENRYEAALASNLLIDGFRLSGPILLAVVKGSPEQIEARRQESLSLIKELNRGAAQLARITGDIESTAKYVQELMDAGDTTYWIRARWSIGVTEEIKEAGIQLNYPPEVQELMQRRSTSPWAKTQRLYQQLMAVRERGPVL